MLPYLSQNLGSKCRIDFTKPVLLGVSGGADSLCLLDALRRLGLEVIVAHFNHQLRPQAKSEQALVAHESARRGLRFVSAVGDVRAYAAEHSLSIEQAARSLRYRFLFAEAERAAAQAVVTAHHADDQVETLLLHLLRGSGLDGLQGMAAYALPNPWSEVIPLVRPLLGIPKSELLAYCQTQNLQPVEDESNADPAYLRNRLRHELLPALEAAAPGLRPALLRLAELAQADVAVLEQQVDEIWKSCLRSTGEGYLEFDLPALAGQPLALQRRLLRRFMSHLRPGLADVDFQAVERAVAFLRGEFKQTDLVGGLYLRSEGQSAWLARWEAPLPGDHWPQWSGEVLFFSPPYQVTLGAGWQLSAELLPVSAELWEQVRQNANPYQAWLDAEQAGARLWLRTRRPGDRFQPLGLGGQRQKLSDLMINVRLPVRARNHWPMVGSGAEILWAPGLALAHPARLTETSELACHLNLKRLAVER